ncbi:MAG: hypothetical protein ACKO96_10450 [Flammeovirgaceae bacterium]
MTFEKLAPPDFPTLVLMLNFTDGDGDLGIDDSFQTDTAFVQQYYLLRPNQGQDLSKIIKLYPFISNVEQDIYPTLQVVDQLFIKKNPNLRLPNASNFPSLKLPTDSNFPSLNCKHWVERKIGGTGTDKDKVRDTAFTVYGETYYNILVDIFLEEKDENGSSVFKAFDSQTISDGGFPNCIPNNFNGRFPVLSSDPGKKAPMEGDLIYRMKSIKMEEIFGTKRFKLHIQVRDRSYHKSNIIETEPTTLAEIRTI